jgi:hypothetical protein
MLILNLGCGTKTSPACTNVDWSMYLRLHRSPLLRRVAPSLLPPERRKRFLALADDLRVHDLRKGIPAADGTVDVVYHCHFLLLLDRVDAPAFQREVFRVLKPGGIQRIVVPDFEQLASAYLAVFGGPVTVDEHNERLSSMIELMVRRESHGTSLQPRLRRRAENLLLGGARRRGETCQWMYDRINLPALVQSCGFETPRQQEYDTSDIPGWNEIGLDLDSYGRQYKPGSLYLECRRPIEA